MKKICLVCDIPNWAFDIIAQKVKKNLDDKFDITVDYYDMREKPDEFYEFLEKHNDCDLIHFFWRKALILMDSDAFKQKVIASGRNLEEYIDEKTLDRYDAVDVNVYQANLYHTKMLIKEPQLQNYLFNQDIYEIPLQERLEISTNLRREMLEIFSGKNIY